MGFEVDGVEVRKDLRLGRGGAGRVPLRRAAETRGAAEKIVERHRVKAEPGDRERHQRGEAGGLRVRRQPAHHAKICILAMVMKKKRIASAPSIHAIMFARLRWRRRYSASSKGSRSGFSVIAATNGRRRRRRKE